MVVLEVRVIGINCQDLFVNVLRCFDKNKHMTSFQTDFPDIFPEESPPALKIPLLRFLYVILDYGKLYGRSMHEI